MLNKPNWLRRYSLWNQVWNIDCQLRYEQAQNLLSDYSPSQIVEVGAGVAGLGFLLGQPVVGIDLAFNTPVLRQFNPYVLAVIGTGTQLPVADNAFQASLAIDSIEHVPPPLRLEAISELLRVASDRVVISIPCGAAAVSADQRLAAWDQSQRRQRVFWLSEHLAYGIPEDEDMRRMIAAAAAGLGKQATISSIDHMPILVHDVIHRVLIFANYRFARALSWGLRAALPVLKALSRKTYYRRFFVVDLR